MKTSTMSKNNNTFSRRHNRQGITLLFVVSMIVLFLLMGTTFLIVANEYRRASKPRLLNNIYRIDNQALVQQAFYELIRGPELANPASPLRTHDILADMYGYGFKARVIGVPTVAQIPGSRTLPTPLNATDHYIALQLGDPDANVPNQVLNLLSGDRPMLPVRSGDFNGRVISFVTGRATGISTRVIDYRVEAGVHTFVVLLPSRIDRGQFSLADLNGSEVIINGRAFSGTGAGAFNQGAAQGTAALAGQNTAPLPLVFALNPNRIGESLQTLIGDDGTGTGTLGNGYLSFQQADGTYNISGNLTGPNESYDGPDYQNMYLAGFDSNGTPIASFYRQSLDSVGGNSLAGGITNRHMFSAFDLRKDAAGNVQLEVDTDLDGVLDAFWMDIGLPVQTTPEGLRYKPLVAYRVVDQDGLLNLNLVGNLGDQINGTGNIQGQGYGPAELAVGATGFLNANDYARILQGDPVTGQPGRYGLGADLVAATGDEVPGGAGRDVWSLQKLFGHPLANAPVGGLFASAHNISGRFPVNRPATPPFVDLNDNTFDNSLPQLDFTSTTFSSVTDTLVENPYEANFAPNHLRGWEANDDDTPFTANELEIFLRPTDIDSNLLPSRLSDLAQGVFGNPAARASVTTDSYEVPMAPAFVRSDAGGHVTLNALLRSRLNNGGNADLVTDSAGNNMQQDNLVREYLSHELLVGLKMDVNRVFGQGVDDDGNGVVDDPGEATNETNVDENGNLAFGAVFNNSATPLDLDNDFRPGTDDDLARYKFAKQLYILMLLTTEDSQLSFSSIDEYRIAVAQWCINVVDFRDPDSIHTPFEFDLNPWDGWDVDGRIQPNETNVAGGRHLVWGAERPELLLTETFASHDRRTEDLDNETPSGAAGDVAAMTTDPTDPDMDFDSRMIPQTSVYLELYNPWTLDNNNQVAPGELGDNTGVNLQRVAPGGEPVWRIGFKRQSTDMNFLRTVVFTDAAPTFTDGGTETFFSSINNVPFVAPGSYAVIGSAGNIPEAGSGVYRTTFGRLNVGAVQPDDIRSISLVPSADPTVNQIFRNEWDPGLPTPAMVETGFPGIAVVIDQPRSLSVSDPDNGYDGMNNTTLTNPEDGHVLAAVRDIPLDATGRDAEDDVAIWRNATTDNFRVVELQRLANPLAAWDPDLNPYLTIDSTSLDLTSFNGLTFDQNNNETDMNERAVANGGVNRTITNTSLSSLERGESDATASVPFGREAIGVTDTPGARENGGGHNFGFRFDETFGRVNTDFPTGNFRWLTWNNRPYVSHLELTNVPASSPENLTADFSNRLTTEDPYTDRVVTAAGGTTLQSKFRHLLNFYGEDSRATPVLANFFRVLDFLEVPSRYVGTERWLNPTTFPNNPFNFVSFYRYPGKININTIPNAQVYNVLMGPDAGTLNFNQFNNSRWRGGAADFFRPYRNGTEGNLVARAAEVESDVQTGLFRHNGATPRVPLFETNSNDAYFQNSMRQRLGNLVTTRSSVFAIWITVGYFEVDENDDLLTNGGGGTGPLGVECGRDSGGAVRNRGFYIFDRSIPVAYEPGKNHNIENGILVQTIIE